MRDLRELREWLRRGYLWYSHRGLASTWKRMAGLRGDRRAPSGRSYTSWLLREEAAAGGARRSDVRQTGGACGTAPRPGAEPLLLSLLVPVHDPPPALLEELVASVLAQEHAAWELLLADDACRAPDVRALLAELPRRDPRVRCVALPDGARGISAATNAAAAAARGEVLLFADHDDLLARGVLARIAAAFAADSALECAYTDEDQLTPWGQRVQPVFKPGPSPVLLLGFNYVTHLLALRAGLWTRLGGLRAEFDGSQDHDLALRAFEEARRIAHVPGIGYHWRRVPGSVADSSTAKPWAYAAGRRAVEAACARRALPLTVSEGAVPGVSVLTPRAPAAALPAHVVLRGPERGCAAWSLLLAPPSGVAPRAVSGRAAGDGAAGGGAAGGGVASAAPALLHALSITRNAWPAPAAADDDAAWLVLDATLEASLASLAPLLAWLALPGVGAVAAAGSRGRRRRHLGWSVTRAGLAQPILPDLPLHAAGPGLLASSVREVAASLGGLACVRAAPAALRAQLAGRTASAADELCLTLSPWSTGSCTLFLPACPAQHVRADAGPVAAAPPAVHLDGCAAWPALCAALPEDFWRGDADRFCPRHELLVDLGLPAPTRGAAQARDTGRQSSRSTSA